MFTMIIMLVGKFMMVYRICLVLRKGYSTLCHVYASDMRGPLLAAVDNPAETWDDTLMKTMDKVFKYKAS